MELFSLIINLAAELAKLARTLLTDGILAYSTIP